MRLPSLILSLALAACNANGREVLDNGLVEFRPCPNGPGYLTETSVRAEGVHGRTLTAWETNLRLVRSVEFDQDDTLVRRITRTFDADGRVTSDLRDAGGDGTTSEIYTRWHDADTRDRFRSWDIEDGFLYEERVTVDDAGNRELLEHLRDGEIVAFELHTFDDLGNWTTWEVVEGDDVRDEVRPEDDDVLGLGRRDVELDDGFVVREEETWTGSAGGFAPERLRELVRDADGRVLSEWSSFGRSERDAVDAEHVHQRVERAFASDGSLTSVRAVAFVPKGYRWLEALDSFALTPLEVGYDGGTLVLQEDAWDHGLLRSRRNAWVDLYELGREDEVAWGRRTILADGFPDDLPWEDTLRLDISYDERGLEVARRIGDELDADGVDSTWQRDGVWTCDPKNVSFDLDALRIEPQSAPEWWDGI